MAGQLCPESIWKTPRYPYRNVKRFWRNRVKGRIASVTAKSRDRDSGHFSGSKHNHEEPSRSRRRLRFRLTRRANALANAIPGETRSRSQRWQHMPDATLYRAWEVPHGQVKGRSYLFHLVPIGIGTAAVESL